MNQTADPLVTALTGGLPLVLIVAVALAAILSLVMLHRYRRGVIRLQGAGTSEVPTLGGGTGDPPPFPPLLIHDRATKAGDARTGSEAVRTMHRSVRATALVLLAAGGVYAVMVAVAFLLSTGTVVSSNRLLVLSGTFAWPAVLTLAWTVTLGRRSIASLVIAYAGLLALLAWPGVASSPDVEFFDITTIWLVYNGAPTLLVLAFLNRRIQAVGPLVLILTVVPVLGTVAAISIAGESDRILRSLVAIGGALGLGASGTLVAYVTAVFAALASAGFVLLARAISRGYETGALSEQSILVGAIMVLFTATYSIFLAFEGPVWMFAGAVPLLVYTLCARAGYAALRASLPGSVRPPRILLLRVFALGRRSRHLYEALSSRWRYVGQLRLISGPDLATTTVEPHEFFAFLGRRLDSLFIDDDEQLDRRLEEGDESRDREGRFRVAEFFCSGRMWRQTLIRLANRQQSDVILMDLRSFSPTNAGCLFEIEALVNLVPLGRVLFIVEEPPEIELLDIKLREFWATMSDTSPNRSAPPADIALFRASGSARADLPSLLAQLVLRASDTAPGSAGPSPTTPLRAFTR